VMQHPRFQSGNITTGFIAEEYPDGFKGAPASRELIRDLVALAAVFNTIAKDREQQIDNQLNGHGANYPSTWSVLYGKTEHVVDVDPGHEHWDVRSGEATHRIATTWMPGAPVAHAYINGCLRVVEVTPDVTGYTLAVQGAAHAFSIFTPRAAALARHMLEKTAADMSKYLLCPMPGLVVSIDVSEGMEVQAGQALAIVEAMKMQNILRAEKSGKISRILASAGDSLAVDAVILEFA
jgi:propionyl-CoA carboxylase alpha chain